MPQGPVDLQAPWCHAGFRLTTSVDTNLMGNPTKRELDRWSATVHPSGHVATGDYKQSLGFADTTFNPQSIFQSPGGVWLQSIWLERNEQPGGEVHGNHPYLLQSQ
ncbi:MAG: hypothetical protein VKL23_06290 [Cyanobacteriota bacterium]|nr:hypothetical protein [Cyanobacteriota bacterium]